MRWFAECAMPDHTIIMRVQCSTAMALLSDSVC